MKYYVYVYLDTRKKGFFKYDDYVFENEPFYIGKGTDGRMFSHIKNAKKSKNGKHPLYDKIKKIYSDGYEPKILKIKEKLIEQEAFNFEIHLINIIGRKDLNRGPLTNLTDGGQGKSRKGWKHKKETKEKIKLKHVGMKHTVESLEKMSNSQKGKHSKEKCNWYGTCLIIKNDKTLRIKKEELSKYLKNGWKKGAKYKFSEDGLNNIKNAQRNRDRSKEKNPCFNTIWIHHPVLKIGKRIKEKQLAEFLNEGWIKGKRKKGEN